MIVFDLRCGGGHVFEAWFASGAAYDDQVARSLVSCPMCGSTAVGKAVMAPAVAAKGNSRPAPAQNAVPSPADVKRALEGLAAAQKEALGRSTWVGDGFATRARAMHAGEEPHAAIHGRATLADAKSLADDGVPVAPLPFPVVPPDQQN